MSLSLKKCNPFIRNALVTPTILEGEGPRKAYDHRLFYILAGTGIIVIENKDYELSSGSLVTLPPAVNYHFRGKMKVIVINYDVTRAFDEKKVFLSPPPESLFEEKLCFDPMLAKGFETPLVLHNLQHFESDLNDIIGTFNIKDSSSDALCSGKLKVILASISNKNENPETLLASKINGYIAINATEIKSTKEIAKHFGYHPVYLESAFKKATGKTLHTAIIEERIKIACRWLINTNATVDAIAEDTGFSSGTHFATVFKSKTGLPPSVWRRKHRINP